MQQQPVQVDLPHKLGREEARRRIAANIHKLEQQIPGGAQVRSTWVGDRLDMSVAAMGQSVEAQIDVQESHVRCTMMLPAMLAMLARPIEAALRKKGSDLLLDDKRND